MITERTTVMIVESQPLMRNALSMALAAEGMNILAEVVDSHDVLKHISHHTPDLILFSVGTPGWDDLETITCLRKALPHTAIAALVTGELDGQAQLALESGANLALEKSAPRTKLLEALHKIEM